MDSCNREILLGVQARPAVNPLRRRSQVSGTAWRLILTPANEENIRKQEVTASCIGDGEPGSSEKLGPLGGRTETMSAAAGLGKADSRGHSLIHSIPRGTDAGGVIHFTNEDDTFLREETVNLADDGFLLSGGEVMEGIDECDGIHGIINRDLAKITLAKSNRDLRPSRSFFSERDSVFVMIQTGHLAFRPLRRDKKGEESMTASKVHDLPFSGQVLEHLTVGCELPAQEEKAANGRGRTSKTL